MTSIFEDQRAVVSKRPDSWICRELGGEGIGKTVSFECRIEIPCAKCPSNEYDLTRSCPNCGYQTGKLTTERGVKIYACIKCGTVSIGCRARGIGTYAAFKPDEYIPEAHGYVPEELI